MSVTFRCIVQVVKYMAKSSRVKVMGILNVTPDSFSDGGLHLDTRAAIEHGLRMIREGADVIDVGGESTRPGSEPVTEEEELERVVPVIRELASHGGALLSVDTTKPKVARESLAAGARLVNDVSMLRFDDELARVVADGQEDTEIVLMHSRGRPADMQEEVSYGDVVEDVKRELLEAVARAERAGVRRDRIWLDPGIGFAKTPQHNLEVLGRLDEIVSLDFPVLVGPSRKSFIGHYSGAPVDDRLGGTAASVAACVLGGAAAVRVHDVSVMRQAADIARVIGLKGRRDGGGPHA